MTSPKRTIDTSEDPIATVLTQLSYYLASIDAGKSQRSAQPLIAEGMRLLRAMPAPRDRDQWAVRTVASGLFVEAASRFRPSLVQSAMAFQQALANAKVTSSRR